MRNNWNKKSWVVGIIILLFCGAIIPGISSKTINSDEGSLIDESSGSVDFATLTFYTLGKNGKKENKIDLPLDEAKYIFNIFEDLKNKSIYEPKSLETRVLKNEFIELLDANSLIPNDLSKQGIHSLINPHGNPNNPYTKSKTPLLGFIFELLFRNRFNLLRFSEVLGWYSDWNVACNIASGGTGIPVPFIILPRPRVIALWFASFATTLTGSLLIPKSFIATGSQQGVAFGFAGVGLTITFGGFTAYGMLGYAIYTAMQAEFISRTNIAPKVSNENPANGANNVPIGLSELSFRLTDDDGDLMDYTVTTEPNIGSKSESGKKNGVYHVPVSGLMSDTDYTWHVTVNDGWDTVEKHFTFTTEKVAPVVSNPSPSDGAKDVSVSLSQLSFKLKDYQGDLMDYTVETVPDIGSFSAIGVGDGTYTVDVSGLDYFRWYKWYVNVTDGTYWTRAVFNFQTEINMVFDPFDEGWMYRKMITIDHNLVDGDLVDFPVLISVVDSDLKNKAQSDGDDILFMDDIGMANRLFHEIESYDGSTGELVAWVRVPSLSSTVDTTMYMYYGNTGCSTQQYPENVWDSNYVAVWHMDGSGYTEFEDSTSNSFDATNDIGSPTYRQSTKIGYGVKFDGIDDQILICDDDKFTFADSSGDKPCSFEAWIKTGKPGTIVTKFTSGKTGEWLFYIPSSYKCQLYLYDTSGENSMWRRTTTDVTNNTWKYVSATFDGGTNYQGITNYLNGVDDSGDGTRNTNYDYMRNKGEIVRIGMYCSENHFDGLMDEVRISNIERSSAWIKTSYNTMNDPLSFFSVGPEETAP